MHQQHLKLERKEKKTRTTQPDQRQFLTIGAINSFNSKRSLDTAMFLKDIKTIYHWESGVATREQHTIKSKREGKQLAISHQTG